MVKAKSSAEVRVADGVGGMRPVADMRFEGGDWPIELGVSASDARTWMLHLDAEVEERQWNASSFSQLDWSENSGTITVYAANGTSPPSVEVVWEKSRAGDLRLKARSSGNPPIPVEDARGFIDAVNTRQRQGRTIRAHRRALLAYEGLPWRGELWIEAEHRLGPPSKHPESLIGPQIVIYDAMVEGIGRRGVDANFQSLVKEVRVFLGIVLGIASEVSRYENAWVPTVDPGGVISDCKVQSIGYFELSPQAAFPTVGQSPAVERRVVGRPGLGPYGITTDMTQQWVPSDTEQLWQAFRRLSVGKRDNLLRAGNAHLIARSLWPEQRTTYAAFLVVACEALKPPGKRYDRMNVYDVVASLVGRVRSKHLHRGELAADEFLPIFMHDHFQDPSFDEMLRVLSRVTRLCLVEWLRCAGQYKVVRVARVETRDSYLGRLWSWCWDQAIRAKDYLLQTVVRQAER